MPLKDMLIHLDSAPHCRLRLDLGLALAARHEAHVIALYVQSHSAREQVAAVECGPALEALLAESHTDARNAALALAEERARAHGIALEWRQAEGDPVHSLVQHGRYCDLVVVGQTDPARAMGPSIPDSLVLALGRPVLVVPHSAVPRPVGRRILVAWDAGREATRAIHDAMPLLERADLVHVIAINPEHSHGRHGDLPGADIGVHLSRHRIRAVCEHIHATEVDVGAMMLNRAADEDCDLIVMGAYGHSRLTELVMGGATRHLLGHMTVPVLLSH